MISCTEFIPSYSELFHYLEEKHGRDEVERYWQMLFRLERSPLYRFVKAEGIRGCWSYWSGTLNEEAADFTMYLNEKRGFYMIKMHKCPSKGRLLELRDAIGVEPYPHYCLHCDYYRIAIEAVGLGYIYNFQGVDEAACSILIYDPKIFDGRVIIDEDTLVMDRKASDNEYFHRAFHLSLNDGLEYLGTRFGEHEVIDYMEGFADHVYGKLAQDAKERGLVAIEEKILATYAAEHAEDALKTTLTGDTLTVEVAWCPALKFLRGQGFEITRWYKATTEVVMGRLAKNAGFGFTMDSYDPITGAAKYTFTK